MSALSDFCQDISRVFVIPLSSHLIDGDRRKEIWITFIGILLNTSQGKIMGSAAKNLLWLRRDGRIWLYFTEWEQLIKGERVSPGETIQYTAVLYQTDTHVYAHKLHWGGCCQMCFAQGLTGHLRRHVSFLPEGLICTLSFYQSLYLSAPKKS